MPFCCLGVGAVNDMQGAQAVRQQRSVTRLANPVRQLTAAEVEQAAAVAEAQQEERRRRAVAEVDAERRAAVGRGERRNEKHEAARQRLQDNEDEQSRMRHGKQKELGQRAKMATSRQKKAAEQRRRAARQTAGEGHQAMAWRVRAEEMQAEVCNAVARNQ